MGRDKYENEHLIKWGPPHDVWFHVDDMSSAHVYLRLPEGMAWTDIPPGALEDACQLTKENSIKGCKIDNVDIIYTPWSNLKKTQGMDVGQIGYHNPRLVKTVKVRTKDSEVINRLRKTRREPEVDFQAEREAYDKQASMALKSEKKKEAARKKEVANMNQAIAEQKHYAALKDDDLFAETASKMKDYEGKYEDYEDDFM